MAAETILIPKFGEAGDYEWLMLSVLCTFLCFLIYLVLYTIGRSFNIQDLERSSKAEIMQAFASLVLISMIVVVVNSGTAFALQLVSGQAYCQIGSGTGASYQFEGMDTAFDFFKCKVGEKAYALGKIQDSLYSAAGDLYIQESQSVGLLGLPVFTGKYVSSIVTKIEKLRLLNNYTTTTLMNLNAITGLAIYLQNNLLNFFLPAGLLLRAFKWTRGIGAFFIAGALSFYFIFPVLFVVTDSTFVPAPPDISVGYEADNFCLPSFSGTVATTALVAPEANIGGTSETFSIENAVSVVAKVETDILSRFIVVFAVTLVFMRYMMSLLGGDVSTLMRAVTKVV